MCIYIYYNIVYIYIHCILYYIQSNIFHFCTAGHVDCICFVDQYKSKDVDFGLDTIR